MSATTALGGRSSDGRGDSAYADITAMHAATPGVEIEAMAAVSRSSMRARTQIRAVPGAGEGFGIVLAAAVDARWPSRASTARRGGENAAGSRDGSSNSRDVSGRDDPAGGERGGAGPSSASAGGESGASRGAAGSHTLGRAALRDLVQHIAAARSAANSADSAPPCEEALAPTTEARALAAPLTAATAVTATAPLPGDIAWLAVQSLAAGEALGAESLSVADPDIANASAALTAGSAAAAGEASAPDGIATSRGAAPATASSRTGLSLPAPHAADHITLQLGDDAGLAGTVRLAVRGDALHATIIASTAAEADRLARDLDSLRRSLHAQGFADTRIAVQSPRAGLPATRHMPFDDQTPRDSRHSREEAATRRAWSVLHQSTPAQEESR